MTDEKALREKLDAMVRAEVIQSLTRHGFGGCDMDYQARALTHPHLRAVEVIALDLLRRLEERDQPSILAYINATPELLSALYDLDLLPEQTMSSPHLWARTACFALLHAQLTATQKTLKESEKVRGMLAEELKMRKWSHVWEGDLHCPAHPLHGRVGGKCICNATACNEPIEAALTASQALDEKGK